MVLWVILIYYLKLIQLSWHISWFDKWLFSLLHHFFEGDRFFQRLSFFLRIDELFFDLVGQFTFNQYLDQFVVLVHSLVCKCGVNSRLNGLIINREHVIVGFGEAYHLHGLRSVKTYYSSLKSKFHQKTDLFVESNLCLIEVGRKRRDIFRAQLWGHLAEDDTILLAQGQSEKNLEGVDRHFGELWAVNFLVG